MPLHDWATLSGWEGVSISSRAGRISDGHLNNPSLTRPAREDNAPAGIHDGIIQHRRSPSLPRAVARSHNFLRAE